jgi:hypothetical protein
VEVVVEVVEVAVFLELVQVIFLILHYYPHHEKSAF